MLLFSIALVISVVALGSSSPLSPNFHKIMVKPEERIISGKKASLGEIPWQVIISKKSNRGFFCGGSIISPDWVLTAAHCIINKPNKPISLSFGSVRLKDEAPVTMAATEFHQHPDYNQETLDNDIALIKLPQSLTFTDTIKPVTLVPRSQASDIFLGARAMVSGFGYTNDEILDYSNDLLYAFVDVVPNKVCIDTYGPNGIQDTGLCAKGSNGTNQNACNGDSGGALVLTVGGKIIQIGINSFAADFRCTDSYPSGFVKVGSYLDFISKKTGIPL